jgi:hypothetical protein
MVRTTLCGQARRGDQLVAAWDAVTCHGCLSRRPSEPIWCLRCRRAITGSCLNIAPFGAWLHPACRVAFERSDQGRQLLASFPDLYSPVKCGGCGMAGAHAGNCPVTGR